MKICTICNEQKNIEEFAYRCKIKNIKHSACKNCRNINSKNTNKFYEFIWNFLLKSKCNNCGTSNPLILEFDHLQLETKVIEISAMNIFNLKDVQKEIDKCQVLCGNCHQIKTHKQFNTWKMFMKKFSNNIENTVCINEITNTCCLLNHNNDSIL